MRRLAVGSGLLVLIVAGCLVATTFAVARSVSSRASGTNSFTAATVTLTNSAIASCPVTGLLPNNTASACTFTATYPGPASAYLAVNIVVEAQAGSGGTRLYNPVADPSNDLTITITSTGPTVTYTVPSVATTCPGGAPSGSVCYGSTMS